MASRNDGCILSGLGIPGHFNARIANQTNDVLWLFKRNKLNQPFKVKASPSHPDINKRVVPIARRQPSLPTGRELNTCYVMLEEMPVHPETRSAGKPVPRFRTIISTHRYVKGESIVRCKQSPAKVILIGKGCFCCNIYKPPSPSLSWHPQ